jgi:hypothetical protein
MIDDLGCPAVLLKASFSFLLTGDNTVVEQEVRIYLEVITSTGDRSRKTV